MRYLFALDLDGTLLNEKSELSKKTIRYIKSISRDHIVCLITGRPLRNARHFYDELGLKTIIGNYNGTKLSIPNSDFLMHHSMNNKEVLDFFKTFEADINNYNLEVDETVYLKEPSGKMYEWSRFKGTKTNIYEIKEDFDGAVISLNSSAVARVNAYFSENNLSIGHRLWHIDMEFDKPHEALLELYTKDFNKGEALNFLKEYYKGKYDKTVAVGDSGNDLDMLIAADIAVAMDNARSETKALAKLIAPHHKKNGCIRIMKKIIKNEL